ncbi:MAG: hypothetical protein KGL95_03190, partial [Patescibacteria group bacterium]|nr:hypothetical protein [Patescibacteria group bacterium]
GATRFVISQIGNVGIGTSSAVTGLQVRNTGTIGTYDYEMLMNPPSGFGARFAFTSNNSKNAVLMGEVSAGQGNFDIKTTSNADWTNGTATWSDRFTVTNTGLVGVGTTSPTAQLDVVGAASISGSLTFRNGVATIQTTALNNLVLGGGSTGAIQLSPAGTTGLFVNTSGQVGIGTTNPSQSLDVSGNIFLSGTLGNHNNNQAFCLSGCGDQTLQVGGSSLFGLPFASTTPLGIIDVRSGTYVSNRGTIPVATISGQTSFASLVVDQSGVGDIMTASYSGNPRFVVSNNGYVTISGSENAAAVTTNPLTSMVHIVGPSGTSGVESLIFDQYGASANAPGFIGRYARGTDANPSAINSGDRLLVIGGRGYGTNAFAGLSNASIEFAAAQAFTNSNQGTYMDFQTTPLNSTSRLERLRIDSTGQIGINTTSPQALLDIRDNGVLGTNVVDGTIPVASLSGQTSYATLVLDQSGTGDIFTASQAGGTRFVLQNNGTLVDSKYLVNNGLFYADGTGKFLQLAPSGSASQCLTSGSGGLIVWGACSGGGLTLQQVYNNGQTIDLSVPGISTNLTLGINAGVGNVLVSPNAGGQAAFIVNDQGIGDIFTASASGSTIFTVMRSGIATLSGALTLAGGATNPSIFLTPVGSAVTTKLNVPLYDPGSYNQIVAMGLPSSANANARVISLFDARTTTHQPTLAVFTPDENHLAGLSWEGSNTDITFKNSLSTGGILLTMGTTVDAAFNTTLGMDLWKGSEYAGGHNNPTTLFIGAGGSTPNAASMTWGDGTGWQLNLGYSNNSSSFVPTFTFEDLGRFGIGTTNLLSTIDIRGDRYTTPVASISGATGKATFVLDQSGVGDIFTASQSGGTRFTISANGNLTDSNYTTAGGIIYGTSTGLLQMTGAGNSSQCLLGGVTPTWGLCSTGTVISPFKVITGVNGGVIVPLNATEDFLVGGTSTASAHFAVLGDSNNTTVASVSAQNTNNTALYLDAANNAIQTVSMQNLTIGGATTGNITLSPLAGASGASLSINADTVKFAGNSGAGTTLTGVNRINTIGSSSLAIMPI